MARLWSNHIVAADPTSWFIQSFEWEFDADGEKGLSDVDEPAASAGMVFTTPSAALRFARKHGIYISDSTPLTRI